MIIGVVGVGKARGVTTVAIGLATACGQTVGNAVIVEADPTGGDIMAWRGLKLDEGGVLKFASHVGASRDREVMDQPPLNLVEMNVLRGRAFPQCAVLPLGVGGAPLATQVEAMWAVDGREELAKWPGVVVVDLGRWGSRLTSDIWSTIDMGVVVCAGDVAGLQRARLLSEVTPMVNQVPTVKLVNGSAWDLPEIRRSSGIDFDAVLAWDVRAAEKIRVGDWKGARKRLLARQLVELARTMVTVDA